MTLASEVTLRKLSTYTNPFIVSSSITLMSSSTASSQATVAVDVVRLNSSGWFVQENTLGMFDNSSMFSASMGVITSSWFGSANTFGAIDVLTSSLLFVPSSGTAANLGNFYEIPETRNTDPITSDNSESDQSVVLVDWNFFPIPTPPEVVQTSARDATRYKKTYSFSRNQPIRIRVFRQ